MRGWQVRRVGVWHLTYALWVAEAIDAQLSGATMLRLVDQPRPFTWWVMRPFSERYRVQYEARELPDWQRIVLRRTVYIPDLKLLYVINAKAASSSLRDMMFVLGGGSRQAGPGRGIYFPSPRWRETVAAWTDPSVYRFTVGRHPVSRAVSAFTNLFVNRNNGFEFRHIPYLRRTGLKFGDASPANFDRFLNYVEEVQAESEIYCDAHLRLQTHNTGLRYLNFDRIGRYEALAADIAAIMAEAGVASYTPVALGWDNKALRDAGLSLTPTQIARIEAIYAEDYERFGYPKTGA